MRKDEFYQEEKQRQVKKTKRSAKAKRRKRTRIAMFTVEALLLVLVLLMVYVVRKWDRIQPPTYEENEIEVETNQMDEKTVESMKGYTTYAAFGVDARNNSTLEKGTHGDVVMVISVNNETDEVRVASIFRDTYLCISDNGSSYGKMTTSYAKGGPKNAINTLNKNFDLQIKNYVTVNWAAVAMAINDLGGVEVDVPSSMFGEHQYMNSYIAATVEATGIGSHQLKGPGVQNLDGIQAVAYARIRYIDSDFGRTARQREVLGKMLEKAKKADLGTLDTMTNHVMDNISTNMTLPQVIGMLPRVFKFNLTGQEGFPLEAHRGAATINGGAMVMPKTLEDTARDLHAFLYADEEYEPSAVVKGISSIIEDAAK